MDKLRIIPEKRRKEILRLIKEKNFLEVSELMITFNASRPTINRDLTILEKEGYLNKTYGGVSYIDKKQIYSFDVSLSAQINEKKAIAKAAARLIKEQDTVVLNTGVTTFEIAKIIVESNINTTVITNSLKILDLFAINNRNNILSLGGDLYIEGYGFQGKITNSNMNSVQGNLAFIGAHGLDLKEGITLPWSYEAELVSLMIERCKKTIVLADYVKFGRLSLYKVDQSLDAVNTVITDIKTDKKYIDSLKEKGINVVVAEY